MKTARRYHVGLTGPDGEGLIPHSSVAEAGPQGGVVVYPVIDLEGGRGVGKEGGREGAEGGGGKERREGFHRPTEKSGNINRPSSCERATAAHR